MTKVGQGYEFEFVGSLATTDVSPLSADTSGLNAGAVSWTQTTYGAVQLVQPSRGPYHWDDPGNWSLGRAPQSGDDVLVDRPDAEIRYGLSQGHVQLASLEIGAAVRQIGLPDWNEAGYAEYRQRYLQATIADGGEVTVGTGDGVGPGLARLDLRGNATTVRVLQSGESTITNRTAVELLTAAGTDLIVHAGQVGVALGPDETSQLATLTIEDGEVRLGEDVTVTGDVVRRDGRLQAQKARFQGRVTL